MAIQMKKLESEQSHIHNDASSINTAGGGDAVMGSTKLYENGQVKYVPMPTPNPKDPLNLPHWRKVMALSTICFFGALALSAETIIGALIPIFALEYAGIDPHILNKVDISKISPPGEINLNPLSILAKLGGPPLWKISLLASLPLLTNGISSYLLVPLSISIGRRPVLLFCGLLAWSGGYWAGFSRSLDSHIAARCMQAIGAGAVEALIPLTVQDLVFIHQRNRAMSMIWATQGLIIVSLGIATPVLVAQYSWRYLYYISSSIAVFAWLLLLVFLPETRWERSADELTGKAIYPLEPGETRPRQDTALYGPRTNWTYMGFFQNGIENRAAGQSMLDTLRTMFFPNILWVILVNSIFISITGAAGQVASSILIASGWKFRTLGLAVLPIVAATPIVYLLGGLFADKTSNWMARRNGGKREPENHLVNAVLPMLFGVAGCVLFGYVGDHVKTTASFVLLTSLFLIFMGFLTVNTVLSVFIVESYPQWAGAVLVNVSSFRCIIGFGMSFKATTWVEQRGFLGSFGLYAAALGVTLLLLPLVFFYGKKIRMWTSASYTSKHGGGGKGKSGEGSYMEY